MRPRTRQRGLGLAAALLMLAPPVPAQTDNVVYRCTNASGAVTFQNGAACPPGSQQQRRVIDIPTPMPAFQPPPRNDAPPGVPLISTLTLPQVAPVTGATPAGDEALAADADAGDEATPRTPPPPLYTCRVYDDSVYYREDDAPPPRCRPLQTIGIGNLPGLGAGQACEQVVDVCAAVPADTLCQVWETRVREAEFRWQFAQGREREMLREAYEAVFKVYRDSDCLG
ncbi:MULTISPECIES: DUF4124 domain-containing protein [Luteimonas]|uniref:DUF4124 domain-containing protein n=1 Tax=Luteimonas TaxID=83614 RepID=UPI000C796584|nr:MULTISPECIES: DUF4124 domain-containing protein [Luteimonas]